MAKKIYYNRKKCIRCSACESIAPNLFCMNNTDGKADLIDGILKNNNYIHTLWNEELILKQTLPNVCPTNAIIIN